METILGQRLLGWRVSLIKVIQYQEIQGLTYQMNRLRVILKALLFYYRQSSQIQWIFLISSGKLIQIQLTVYYLFLLLMICLPSLYCLKGFDLVTFPCTLLEKLHQIKARSSLQTLQAKIHHSSHLHLRLWETRLHESLHGLSSSLISSFLLLHRPHHLLLPL